MAGREAKVLHTGKAAPMDVDIVAQQPTLSTNFDSHVSE